MCQTDQETWASLYQEIIRYVLSETGASEDSLNVDIDFPAITPEDAGELAKALRLAIESFPNFADNRTIMQQALMSVGVTGTDVNRVLDELFAEDEDGNSPVSETRLLRALRNLEKELDADDHDPETDDPEAEAGDPETQFAEAAVRRNGNADVGVL